MAKKNYDELARNVLEQIGGAENVISVTHCITRLRFKLKDESKANTDAIKKIKGVVSVVQAGGQYQVVIGSDVGDAYQALGRLPGVTLEGAVAIREEEDIKKKRPLDVIVDTVSGAFLPTLPAMTAAGLLKALCAMLPMLNLLSTESTTYRILYAMGDAFFYFLPIILGASTAKKFGVNQFLGMVIGGVLVYPDLTAMYSAGEAVTFAGVPVSLISYPQTVLPVLFGCMLLALVDKLWKRVVPKVVANIFVPLLDLLVTIPITLIVIGPVTDVVGSAIADGITFLMTIAPPVTGFVVGALWSLMIMMGLHFPLVMIELNNLMTTGHMRMLPATFPCTFAHAGAALGVALRTRNKDLKDVGIAAFISGIFGTISEPAIYGVNLKYKRPFLCASIFTGVGGAIIAMAGADCTIQLGGISIYTMPMFVSLLPGGVGILVGVLVGFFGSAIASYITFSDSMLDQ